MYIEMNCNLSMGFWLAALIWVILGIKALPLPLSISPSFGIFVACICSMKFFLNSNNWQLIKLHNVQ